MARVRFHRAVLCIGLVTCCAAQSPKSITYLRLGPQIVEQRLQPPASSEDWSIALRQQYVEAGIPSYQIVEQAVPGSSQKMVMCTIAGRSDSVILVSASLARPKDDDAASVAWASLAMLPLLAESLNAVSTDSAILFLALPGDKHHHPGSSWYVRQLSEAQRKNIKAAVEVSEVGRGAPTFDTDRRGRSLAEWLDTSAVSLGVTGLQPSAPDDSLDFGDAKAFRSAGVPAITVSSQPVRVPHSFTAGYTPLNKLRSDEYYNTYKLLCVFLLELDRAARGTSSQSMITPAKPNQRTRSVFTEEEASKMIVLQVGEARASYRVSTLWPTFIPELHDMVCDMARSDQLEPAPFQRLLEKKKLSGNVAVFGGDYPGLSPGQMQGLKVGRFHKLSVATCVLPTPDAKPPTYWIAVLAYQ